MQIPIFNYNWSFTALEVGEIWQEFRFGEAEPVDPDDDRIRDFDKDSVFQKPNWLKKTSKE